jgi:hypothetical protein
MKDELACVLIKMLANQSAVAVLVQIHGLRFTHNNEMKIGMPGIVRVLSVGLIISNNCQRCDSEIVNFEIGSNAERLPTSSVQPLFFNASNRALFRLLITLNVFFFSSSPMLSQFIMRLNDPSTFTTIGPKWSNGTVVSPLLISSKVLGSFELSISGEYASLSILF